MLKTWKPPARREYAPKALDPGQSITWTQETPGYWTGPGYGAGEWVTSVLTQRSGIIWSDGPHARSYWVTPDDAPAYPVLVSLPTPRRAQYGDTPAEAMSAERARQATLRAENVRRAGVYSVVQEVRRRYGYRDDTVYRYHADPACPHAEGMKREAAPDPWERYTVRGVVAMLTGEKQEGNSPSLMCKTCVWLEPEPARELVAA